MTVGEGKTVLETIELNKPKGFIETEYIKCIASIQLLNIIHYYRNYGVINVRKRLKA